jgi:hypothetical protein
VTSAALDISSSKGNEAWRPLTSATTKQIGLLQSTPAYPFGKLICSCRDKWLFVSATPLSSELPEVANPSDLFTHDPFDFDTADPDTQVRHQASVCSTPEL